MFVCRHAESSWTGALDKFFETKGWEKTENLEIFEKEIYAMTREELILTLKCMRIDITYAAELSDMREVL